MPRREPHDMVAVRIAYSDLDGSIQRYMLLQSTNCRLIQNWAARMGSLLRPSGVLVKAGGRLSHKINKAECEH